MNSKCHTILQCVILAQLVFYPSSNRATNQNCSSFLFHPPNPSPDPPVPLRSSLTAVRMFRKGGRRWFRRRGWVRCSRGWSKAERKEARTNSRKRRRPEGPLPRRSSLSSLPREYRRTSPGGNKGEERLLLVVVVVDDAVVSGF